MLLVSSKIPNHSSVKNIIFDFGGVICDLEIQRTVQKFKTFGKPKIEDNASEEEKDQRFELLVSKYETGLVTSQQFRDEIRSYYQVPPSDQAIDDAWNALLVGIPATRIHLLENIRNDYRLFLLSNSNEIHYLKYCEDLRQYYGYPDFNALFENTYFSFRLHLKKPDPAIFKWVLEKNKLDPNETAFIDDTYIHVKVAIDLGINAYRLQQGEDITDLFNKP
jgi:putative hydrolase of the HAD superfamily